MDNNYTKEELLNIDEGLILLRKERTRNLDDFDEKNPVDKNFIEGLNEQIASINTLIKKVENNLDKMLLEEITSI